MPRHRLVDAEAVQIRRPDFFKSGKHPRGRVPYESVEFRVGNEFRRAVQRRKALDSITAQQTVHVRASEYTSSREAGMDILRDCDPLPLLWRQQFRVVERTSPGIVDGRIDRIQELSKLQDRRQGFGFGTAPAERTHHVGHSAARRFPIDQAQARSVGEPASCQHDRCGQCRRRNGAVNASRCKVSGPLRPEKRWNLGCASRRVAAIESRLKDERGSTFRTSGRFDQGLHLRR